MFTGKYTAAAGTDIPFTWNGQGNDGTQWPDGKLHDLGHGQGMSRTTMSASPRRVQGVVSSVDLTQSPPLLTIDGASYTLSQVKSIIATSSN
ncbi:hypothetical protein BRDID11002_40660 [Bradyrhizobium diazoefficiens]